jgi:hypothetical protein
MLKAEVKCRLLAAGVSYELLAAQGEVDRAVTELVALADEATGVGDHWSAAWLLSKAAEILLADCQLNAAWGFHRRIRSIAESLPEAFRMVLQRNFSLLAVNVGEDRTQVEFYEAVDRESHLSSIRETQDLLQAEQASRESKHYDSLPPL